VRTLLGLVAALVLFTATPALAHWSGERVRAQGVVVVHHASAGEDGDEPTETLLRSEREGNDTDLVEFATVAVAGLALMGAVAALIFARVRQPV
jgi:hypothetical protein